MIKSMLVVVALSAMALVSACSTLGDYPAHWHSTSSSIHVYVSTPGRMVEIPAGGQVVTLLDAVCGVGHYDAVHEVWQTEGDLSHVTVFRRNGSETTRLDVDVHDIIRTGNNANNIQLRPGDVVGIAD